jgi:hypothetical protein
MYRQSTTIRWCCIALKMEEGGSVTDDRSIGGEGAVLDDPAISETAGHKQQQIFGQQKANAASQRAISVDRLIH